MSAPQGDPIHLLEARAQVKQDIGDDDALFNIWIGAAADFCQAETWCQLVSARWKQVMDAFPNPSQQGIYDGQSFSLPKNAILLDRSPLIQVVSITYIDMNGSLATMPPSDYTVDMSCSPPRITPVFGKIWPIPLPQMGSVQVTFDAGYIAPIVIDINANTIAPKNWKTLAVNDSIRVSNSGGALPAPLQVMTDYYVKSVVSAGVYTLSATPGGAVIDITDAGTGNQYLGELPRGLKGWMLMRIESLFTHRGEVAVVKGVLVPLPYIDRLLDPFRVSLI